MVADESLSQILAEAAEHGGYKEAYSRSPASLMKNVDITGVSA